MNAVQQKLMEIRARNAALQNNGTTTTQPMNPVRAKLLEIRARNAAQAGQPVSQPTGALAPVMTQQKQVVLPPAQPTQQNKPGLLRRAAGAVGDVVVGTGKAVIDAPRRYSSLGADLGNKFGETGIGKKIGAGIRSTLGGVISPETARTLQAGLQGGAEQADFTKPKNTAQKIGFGAEQIAEFFVPGGAAGKLGKVVSEAGVAAKLPRAGKFLGATTKAIADAGLAAGQTATQEGKLDDSALAAGGLTLATGVIGSGLNRAFKNVPENMWKKILNRTAVNVAKKPGVEKEASKLGLLGTKKSILNTAKNTIQSAELELDNLLKNSTGQIDTKNVAPYLEELKTAYSQIPGEKSSVELIANLQDEIAAKGVLSPVEANKIKREIYSKISKSYGKGTLEIPAKTDAQKQIARGLKEEIEKIVPEAKTINQRSAIYLEIKKSIEKQFEQRAKGIAGTGLGFYDIASGGLGALAGLGSGGVGTGVLAGVAVKRAYESTPFRSGVAKLANYYNELSPTKKALFYSALKGLTAQTTKLLPESNK